MPLRPDWSPSFSEPFRKDTPHTLHSLSWAFTLPTFLCDGGGSRVAPSVDTRGDSPQSVRLPRWLLQGWHHDSQHLTRRKLRLRNLTGPETQVRRWERHLNAVLHSSHSKAFLQAVKLCSLAHKQANANNRYYLLSFHPVHSLCIPQSLDNLTREGF